MKVREKREINAAYCKWYVCILFPDLRIKGLGNAFNSLHMLKNLEIPLPFLVGFGHTSSSFGLGNVLPRNIEWLTITDDLRLGFEWEWENAQLFQILEAWLRDWRSTTIHLRGLNIRLTEGHEFLGFEMQTSL